MTNPSSRHAWAPARRGDDAPGLVADVLAGGAAGTVATVAMSGLMLAAGRVGILGAQPPRLVVDRALSGTAAADDAGEEERDVLAGVAHLVIGALAGGAFAIVRLGAVRLATRLGRGDADLFDRAPAQVALGIGYALGFWALAYGVAAPAIQLLPPPTRDRPGRPPVMIAAHVVFGIGLAVAHRALRRR